MFYWIYCCKMNFSHKDNMLYYCNCIAYHLLSFFLHHVSTVETNHDSSQKLGWCIVCSLSLHLLVQKNVKFSNFQRKKVGKAIKMFLWQNGKQKHTDEFELHYVLIQHASGIPEWWLQHFHNRRQDNTTTK